jgi:small subunit ribosomal protein S6
MAVQRLYEGMFLVDSAMAAADWEGTLGVIENVLKRANAEIVVMRKWDERRLAYEIDRKSRGTYILCYFKADTQRISGIEKDVQLSEKIMRVLILGTEGRPAEMVERDISGLPKQEAAPESESAEEGDKPIAVAAASEDDTAEAEGGSDEA